MSACVSFPLQLEDGTFEVTREGLDKMSSGYFTSLLSSGMELKCKLENVYIDDFRELYAGNFMNYIEGSDPAWTEDWCNKLVLADRLQMPDAVYHYTSCLQDLRDHSELPLEIIEILLKTRRFDLRMKSAQLVDLIYEGLPIELIDSRPHRSVLKDKRCTPEMFAKVIVHIDYQRDDKWPEELFHHAQKGLCTYQAACKLMLNQQRRMTVVAVPNTSPVEIELKHLLRYPSFDPEGKPTLWTHSILTLREFYTRIEMLDMDRNFIRLVSYDEMLSLKEVCHVYGYI